MVNGDRSPTASCSWRPWSSGFSKRQTTSAPAPAALASWAAGPRWASIFLVRTHRPPGRFGEPAQCGLCGGARCRGRATVPPVVLSSPTRRPRSLVQVQVTASELCAPSGKRNGEHDAHDRPSLGGKLLEILGAPREAAMHPQGHGQHAADGDSSGSSPPEHQHQPGPLCPHPSGPVGKCPARQTHRLFAADPWVSDRRGGRSATRRTAWVSRRTRLLRNPPTIASALTPR